MSWQQALERTVTGLGYELVDVERSAGGLLRVTIDRVPGQVYANGPGEAVNVDDCEIVTRQLRYLLEVEGVDYARLEVSSPGLDRPLKKPSDWQRFAGAEVEVTLREKFHDRRKWRGRLMAGAPGGPWRLLLSAPDAPAKPQPAGAKAPRSAPPAAATPDMTLDFALDEVREARLVPVLDFKGTRAVEQRPAASDVLDPVGARAAAGGGAGTMIQAAAAQADGGQE